MIRTRKHAIVRGPCPDGKYEIVRPDGSTWMQRFTEREDAVNVLLASTNPFRSKMDDLNNKLRDALQIAGYDPA
jgi:hypothetical protein